VFELRAATALSRRWAGQGRTDAAHALLADIYSWFTEGHDTADLQEAKSMLEALDRRAAGQLPHDSGERAATPPRSSRTT
jgi:predicted ATPase